MQIKAVQCHVAFFYSSLELMDADGLTCGLCCISIVYMYSTTLDLSVVQQLLVHNNIHDRGHERKAVAGGMFSVGK